MSSKDSSSSESESGKAAKVVAVKKRKDTSANCVWKPAHDAELVATLTEQKKVGNQSENGWKDLVWTLCSDALLTKFPDAPGGAKTAPKCSDHYTNVCVHASVLEYAHVLTTAQRRLQDRR